MTDSSFNIQKYFKRGKTVVLTLRQDDADEIRQWSDKDTSHLLLLMSTMFGEFQNQRKRKKDVWEEVSKELTEEGYPWSAEDCRKKWSNMVRTFKGIQEQKAAAAAAAAEVDCNNSNNSGSTKKTKIWPFYEDILELFLRNGADCLPEAASVVQILNSQGQGQGQGQQGNLHGKTQRGVSLEVSSSSSSNGLLGTRGIINHSSSNDEHNHHHHEEITIVDYQAMINAATGNNLDLVSVPSSSSSSSGVVASETPTASSTVVVTTGSSTNNSEAMDICSGNDLLGNKVVAVSSSESPVKRLLTSNNNPKSYFSRKRKLRNRGKSTSTSFSDLLCGNTSVVEESSLVDKLIAVTTQQNEKLLEKLSAFHEQSIAAMKERNAILSRIYETLQQKQFDAKSNMQKAYEDTLSAAISSASSRPITMGSHAQLSSVLATSANNNNNKNLSGQTDSSSMLNQPHQPLQTSSNNSIRDLNEPILHDTVVSVDSDPIHTIISQDVSTSGLTFHLDVPTSVSDVVDVNDPRISKGYRLENIQSDVNLAAFSATLHPTLVSVNSAKKPRSSLSKSVSVPLHTTTTQVNHRKIAPKKDTMQQ